MNVRTISTLAVFIALSVVGAFIKIPSPIGSMALDSFPALLAAALLGPVAGGIVAGLGHIVSALIAGMPLGPFHFLIMIEMFIFVWLFGVIWKAGLRMIAYLAFFISNAFIMSIPFAFIIGPAFYAGMVPSLTAATAINVVVAMLLAPRLTPVLKRMIFKENFAK